MHSKGDSNILLIEKDGLLLKRRNLLMYSIRIFSQSLTLLFYLNGLLDQQIKSMTVLIELHTTFFSKRNYKITSKSSFKPVSEEFLRDLVNDLSSNKAAWGEIPLKILKECDFSLNFSTNCIYEAIETNKFLGSLKLTNTVLTMSNL